MNTRTYTTRALVAACGLALASAGGLALADNEGLNDTTLANEPVATAAGFDEDLEDVREDKREAMELLANAEQTLDRMRVEEPELYALLPQAQGVFVMPHYGRGALVVGVRGGEGVLLPGTPGNWGQPVFYDYGGISAGLQAGAEAGSIVMILQTPDALQSFMQENNWSLNAEAGLTVVNWAGRVQGSLGKGDVIVWSDAKGLLGDLALSVTDIHFDEEETAAFYGVPNVTREDIAAGRVTAPEVAEVEIEIVD